MKYRFEKLINRSYEAIVNRGLITPITTLDDFFDKIEEEKKEILDSKTDDNLSEELTDLATVCFMCLVWMGRNPVNEFEKVVNKNEKRVKIS